MHLLILHAASPSPEHSAALDSLPLPNLRSLLRHLRIGAPQALPTSVCSAAHEPLLAQLTGLPWQDGHWPDAALQTASTGPCAWLTPCHWDVDERHMTLRDPRHVPLDEAESRALLAAVAPLLHDDALTLNYHDPGRWLLRGDLMADLRCAAPERVIAHPVHDHLPQGAAARRWRTLQAEIEMLLYQHPVNEARRERGLPDINAVWLSGAGTLVVPPDAVRLPDVNAQLWAASRDGDLPTWTAAWQTLDAQALQPLAARVQAGEPVRLGFCGASTWRTLGPERLGGLDKLWKQISPQRPSVLLQTL